MSDGNDSGNGSGTDGGASDPELEEANRRKALADANRAIAEAEKAAADARIAQFKAMLPDLTSVQDGSTNTTGETPLFGGVIAHHALDAAVERIDRATLKAIPDSARILVTTNGDLATADAVYLQTKGMLQLLRTRASALLGQADQDGGAAASTTAAAAAVGAVASVIPGLMSLVSANRTVNTAAAPGDAQAAAIAIADALRDNRATTVWLDDLRLVGDAAILEDVKELDASRSALSGIANGDESPKKAAAKELLDEVTAFLASIRTAPTDGGRSPLVTAALHERLHTDRSTSAERFTHVLWVQGIAATTQQVVDDRPLMLSDKFAVVATMSVPWALIDTTTSALMTGGVAVGTVQITGGIGENFSIRSIGASG